MKFNLISRLAAFLLLIAIVITVAPTSANAQGAFYMEVEKDGRIYVFNNMKAYHDWNRSGELGVSITDVAAGSNGETIIFDSDQAIHLYNFKHGLPGKVILIEERKPVMKFAWKDGKTTFESDNAALSISNRIQVRHTHEDPETGDGKGSFRIRRAKTKFEGWFYNKNLTYELQMNWADVTNALEDAWMNYDISRNKKFQIKAGQFKVPFGRQELTSSGSQQFADRSIVSGEFEKGRDTGIQIWGLLMNERYDYRFGIFNGAGRNKSTNDNPDYQVDARITYQPWGDLKYSESDFENTDKPLFAVAANIESNKFVDAAVPTAPIQTDRTVYGIDLSFKYKGFSAMGEGFQRAIDPAGKAEFDSPGFHFQVGYFLIPKRFEIAGRYATFDPADTVSGNDKIEKGIAVNYFFNKHNLKLQGDFRRLEDEATGTTNNEIRIQTQFIF